MSEISNEVAGLKDLLQLVQNNKNGHIFAHSILASFIAGHILKKVPWGSDDHILKINFVLCFHDIFLAPIYNSHPNLKHEDELLLSTELTEKEKNIVLDHARLAAEANPKYKIVLNTIIGNLKEKFNRSTYIKIIQTLDSLRL